MGCGHPSSWSGANRKAIRGLPRGGQLESAHHDKRMAKIARHARGSKFKLRQNPLYRLQQWTGRAPSPPSHMHLWGSRGPAPGRTRAGFSCVGHLFSCQAFAVIFSPAISRYGVAPSNRCLAEKPVHERLHEHGQKQAWDHISSEPKAEAQTPKPQPFFCRLPLATIRVRTPEGVGLKKAPSFGGGGALSIWSRKQRESLRNHKLRLTGSSIQRHFLDSRRFLAGGSLLGWWR
jgi:hypothetical protein